MTTCPTREELVAVLDGLAAPDGLAAARRHVDACARCRGELARLEEGIAVLRAGSPTAEPSPFFAARLAARLAAAPPPRPRGLLDRLLPGTPWRLAAAGALAAALSLAVVVVHRSRAANELAVAERLELLEELEVVASVGDVESAEDVAVISALDGLRPREVRP